jgi:membrane-associated phospholipid phosphatase
MSEFLLTATVPWLIARREMLWGYARGVGVMSVICFFVFALYPVASPRPHAEFRDGMFGAIIDLDGPLSAFPSLHAGFLVYTLGVAWLLFRSQARFVGIALVLTWAAAVMYATIATRQHYALDLVAGGAVGLLAHRLAWRSVPTASNTICRNNAVESQVGSR